MLTVGTLLQYISTQKYQLSPALLTFHNYLQHLWTEDEPWSPQILSHFFHDCLVYPHWVQNRSALREDLQECLLQFEAREKFDLGLRELRWPDQMQVIEIEKHHDFSDLIHSYLAFQYSKSNSRFRLIQDGDKIFYGLILHADRSLTIRQFDRRFLIREGFLEPLRMDLSLSYTPSLSLEDGVPHKLEVAPFVTCRFTNQGALATGHLVRGYIFQRFHAFRDSSLESYPRLFYTLKRVEQFFLKRESDPFYQALTQELERALNLLRFGDTVEPTQLTDLQVRTQNALEYVFHGDKLLGLLLRDLENQMGKRPASPGKAKPAGALGHLDFVESSRAEANSWATKQKNKESDSTNSLQIPGLPLDVQQIV